MVYFSHLVAKVRHSPRLLSIVAGGILILVLILVRWLKPSVETSLQASSADMLTVVVKESVAHEKPQEILINGHTEASARIHLKAETRGRVISQLAYPGTLLGKGDEIILLSIDNREHILAYAKARAEQMRLEYKATVALMEQSFHARLQGAKLLADLKESESNLNKAALDLSHTRIISPIKGVLEDCLVREGDFVDVGMVAAKVICLDPLWVVGYVSEKDYPHIHVASPVRVTLSNGSTYDGEVIYVAPAAEEKTRTFQIRVAIKNPNSTLPEGLTATIKLISGVATAHELPSSLLSLDDRGVLGVKILTASNEVKFRPVDILSSNQSSVWVEGLPSPARVIVRGQEFVLPGAIVKAEEEKAALNPRKGAGE